MPAKAECDFFIRGAAQFETESGSNSSRMGDEAKDINEAIVPRIWMIGEAAS